MKLLHLVFSYDRPLQLWGLVRSLLDNTDLGPDQIVCLCRASRARFHAAYHTVEKELGCHIVQENHLYSRPLSRLLRPSLVRLVLKASAGAEYVAFAVDDMMYFRQARFEEAMAHLQSNPDVCLWSWRIGVDLQPHPSLEVAQGGWRVRHAETPMPYRYIFHTDGSVFRRRDLVSWLNLLPAWGKWRYNLNSIEAWLARYSEANREQLPVGGLHAGPREQACITWQINKVTTGGARYYARAESTSPERLLNVFENGGRICYASLYGYSDWLLECNRDWDQPPTHVAPTEAAVKLWLGLMSGDPARSQT